MDPDYAERMANAAVTTQALPLPSVQGFTFTVGGAVPKLDKLIYRPDNEYWVELLAKILSDGTPCETPRLRCDHQVKSDPVNTQCQIGGSDNYVKRTDASNQSTSMTMVMVPKKVLQNKVGNQAQRDAHDYSWRTGRVVTIGIATTTATVGVTASSGVQNIVCSACGDKRTIPASETIPDKCKRCKKPGTLGPA